MAPIVLLGTRKWVFGFCTMRNVSWLSESSATFHTHYTCWIIETGNYILCIIQGVPLATEPGIFLIILTPMKILQRNLNRSTFVVWEMKRNVSVVCVFVCVCVCVRCNILISGKIIKEIPGSVASGTCWISYFIYIYIYIYMNVYCPTDNRQSSKKNNKNQLLYTYGCTFWWCA